MPTQQLGAVPGLQVIYAQGGSDRLTVPPRGHAQALAVRLEALHAYDLTVAGCCSDKQEALRFALLLSFGLCVRDVG